MVTLVVHQVREAASDLVQFAIDAVDFDRLWGWASLQAATNESRAFWADFLLALGVLLSASSAIYWLMRYGLRDFGLRLRHRVRRNMTATRRY
jgi:cystathionine beta-lyase/cystathionine gamma-synthase